MSAYHFQRLVYVFCASLLVLPFFMLSACELEPAPPPPVKYPVFVQTDPTATVSYADQLVAVAQLIPGFGGMFFDEQYNLNVYLSGMSWEESRITPEIVETKITAALVEVFGQDLAQPSTPFLFIQGQYDIIQLTQWLVKLATLNSTLGVKPIGLNEMNNRLYIGIDSIEMKPTVETAIVELGVPLDAVRIIYLQPA